MNETLSSNNFREDSDKLGNTLSKAEISNLKEFIKDKRDQEIEAVYDNTNTELEDLITKEYWYANQNLLQEKGYTVGDLQYALNKNLGLDNSVGFAFSPGEYDYLGGHGNGDKLVTDDVFAKNTFLKLIQFQRENGLTVDGLSGPQTQAKLFEGIKKTELPSQKRGEENRFWEKPKREAVKTESGVLRDRDLRPVRTKDYNILDGEGFPRTDRARKGGNPLAGLGDVLGGLFGGDTNERDGASREKQRTPINPETTERFSNLDYLVGQEVLLKSRDGTIDLRYSDGRSIGKSIRSSEGKRAILTGGTSIHDKYVEIELDGKKYFIFHTSFVLKESQIDNGENLSGNALLEYPLFKNKLNTICNKLGCKTEDLIRVMDYESNIDPKAKNPISSGTGLIQFMGKTALDLGTSVLRLRGMSGVEQLDYVYKYLEPYKGKLNSVSALYLSIFYPAGIGKVDNFVLGSEVGDERALEVANDNPIIAKGGHPGAKATSVITVGRFKEYVEAKIA